MSHAVRNFCPMAGLRGFRKVAACAASCIALSISARVEANSVALRGATLVDIVSGELHPSTTVVIDGELIQAIGPDGEVTVPDKAEIVDADGGFLLPGLWDTHVHSAAGAAWHQPS